MKKWMLGLGMFLWAATALAQPVISNVFVSAATSTTATINWTTSTPSSSQIRYGFDISLPFNNNPSSALVTNHSQTLTFLNPATLYYFAVVSADSGGSTQSTTTNFSLCGAPGTVPIQGTSNGYYLYGSYTLTWVPPAGTAAPPTICGQPVTTTVTGKLDSGASFSTIVADSYMTVPGPGTWHVSVTDAGNIAPVAFNYPIAAVNTNVSTPLQHAANASGLTFCLSNPGASVVFPSNCGGGGGGGVVVELNGTPISPASPANFVNTASITWAFVGGQIQATAAGGGCGSLAGDVTSTDCGTNNLTTPPAGPAFLQAFGDNQLNTVLGTHMVAVGNGNGNLFPNREFIGIGDTNGASLPSSSPQSNDVIGIGNNNIATVAGSIPDLICIGDANCQTISWLQDSVGIGNANFQNNVGTNVSTFLSEAVAIGLANVEFIYTGSSIVGIGQAAAGGCGPAQGDFCTGHTGSTSVSQIISIGDASGNTIGSNVDDVILLGDGVMDSVAPNSFDIIGIGDAALQECEISSLSSCASLSIPTPTAMSEVIGIGTLAGAFDQGSNIIAIGLRTVGGGGSAAPITGNSGTFNVGIGDNALAKNTTGSRNVGIGPYAGADGYVFPSTFGNSNKTGSNNTWVGYDSGPNTTTQLTNSAAFGYQAHNTASNQLVLGNSSMTQAILFGTGDGCLSSTAGVVTGSGSACGSGGGGASNVTINGGSTLTTANFNGTTPAAGANFINVTWQVSAPSVSAEVPFGSASGFGVLECGSGTTCTGGVISVSGGGGGDTITSPNSTLAVGGTSTNTTLDLVGAAGKIMAGATPALTFTPTLGVSGTAGTLSMFPASGNFTTTWGSAATASNTILGFATAPATGDLISCTTSTTVCTLTDAGFLASAVVRETASDTTTTHVLHATASGAIGTFSAIVIGDLPTITIPAGGTNATSAPGAGAIPNTSSTTASTWTRTPTLGASGTVGTIAFGNATSGTVTLGTVAGALGSVTASLPANTGTIAELNFAQTWSALQTFGTNISIGGVTATGATGTGNVVFSASPSLTGTPDASAATQFKLPVAAAYASIANGEQGYDTTNLNWHLWGNGVDNINAIVPASVSITNNDCVKWTKSGNVITLNDAGSACGSGGSAWSALTNPTGTLSLSMGNSDTTQWTVGSATGANNMFTWTDTATNSSATGILAHFTTTAASTLIPWQADVNGVGWKVGTDGTLDGIGTSASHGFSSPEGTAIAGASTFDTMWSDSTAHRWEMTNNNGSATAIVGFSDLASSSLFGVVMVDNTTITAASGVISAAAGVTCIPGSFAAQTDGATVTWAIGSAICANASLTFTTHGGSRTLNLTGLVNGGSYVIWLKQDGTGGEGLTLGTGCTWKVSGGGSGAITPSTGANAIDVLAFTYDGTNCYANFNKNFN